MQVNKKKGRPTDSPKTNRESFRLSNSDMEKLNFCVEKTGESKTEIVRKGIDKVYNELKK
jgi:predicted DNA-binding protein